MKHVRILNTLSERNDNDKKREASNWTNNRTSLELSTLSEILSHCWTSQSSCMNSVEEKTAAKYVIFVVPAMQNN